MNNNQFKYIMILLVLLLIFFVIMIDREGAQCMSNPLTYGANKIANDDTGAFTCFCSFDNPKYERIIFDKDNVSTLS